jgi:hypothetical protein
MNTEKYTELKNLAIGRDGKCLKCGTSENLIAHHIIPRHVNGKDELNNLATLCRSCHKKVHVSMANGVTNSPKAYGIISNGIGHQINLDQNAYNALLIEKDRLKEAGIAASFSDAVRSLCEGRAKK